MKTTSQLLLAFATLFAALCASLFAPTGLHAATMNKCLINGVVSYQQAPCPSTQARKDPTLEELNAAERKRRAATPPTKAAATPAVPASPAEIAPPDSTPPKSRRCDGRQHCSQMTSCAEAKFFLGNCPGVKMDGDGDGIPCEDHWCRL